MPGLPFLTSGSALQGFGGSRLLGLFEPVAVAVDGEDFGAMHQAIDEGHDAGSVGEDLVPFAEGLVGREHGGTLLIAARDELEQQIGVTSIVGQVTDLIDAQQRYAGVAPESACELHGSVLCGQIMQHVGVDDEARVITTQHCLVQQVLRDHRLADAVGTNQDDVGRAIEEVQGQQFLDELAVDSKSCAGVSSAQSRTGHSFSDGAVKEAHSRSQANFQRLAFVNYEVHIKHYDLVVDHGGTGIINHCLANGIPAIVYPTDYEQFDYAARLECAGLAKRLRRIDQLPSLLDESLNDPALKLRCLAFAARNSAALSGYPLKTILAKSLTASHGLPTARIVT